jgi:hypothetical protein
VIAYGYEVHFSYLDVIEGKTLSSIDCFKGYHTFLNICGTETMTIVRR